MVSRQVFVCAFLVLALFVVPLSGVLSYRITLLEHHLHISRTQCDTTVNEEITYQFDEATTQLKRVLSLGKGVEIEFETLGTPDNQATLLSNQVEDDTFVIEWSFPQQSIGSSKKFDLAYKVKDLMRVNGTTDNAFSWNVFSEKEAAVRVDDLRVEAVFLFDVDTQITTFPLYDNSSYNPTTSETTVEWDDYDVLHGTNWVLNVSFPTSIADLTSCLDIDAVRSNDPPLWLAILVLVTVLVILVVIVVAIVIAVVSQILHNRAIHQNGPSLNKPASVHTIDTTSAARPTTDVFDPTATPEQPPAISTAI